jgi:type IV pilus assembly protein PilE
MSGVIHTVCLRRMHLGHAACPRPALRERRGFTFIEAMFVLMVSSIIAVMAISAYRGYIQRSLAAAAQAQLDRYGIRMQKAFQDSGNYGVGAGCAVPAPADVRKFAFKCELTAGGQGFVARAEGAGGMVYSIDERGMRRTEAFPGAATVPADCWMVEKDRCQ